MDVHDSDRTTEPVHRDCLLSVSHSQYPWRLSAGRRLVDPFWAIAIGRQEGSKVACHHVRWCNGHFTSEYNPGQCYKWSGIGETNDFAVFGIYSMSACTKVSQTSRTSIFSPSPSISRDPRLAQSLAQRASLLETRQLYLADYNLLKSKCFVFIGEFIALPFRLEALHKIDSST